MVALAPWKEMKMANPRRSEELEAALAPDVAAFGLELDSVLLLKESGVPVVRVVVDSPEGEGAVDSDALAEVSRAVSKRMDDLDPIDGEYMLEVSTPGAERELTTAAHWRRQVGRLVRIRLRDGSALEGRLREVGEDSVTVDLDGVATTIALADVKKARPRVEFGSEE